MGKGYGIEQWEIEEMDEARMKKMDPLFDNHPSVVEQRKRTAEFIEGFQHYATGTMCARCRIKVDQDRDCLGESGIYSPTGRAFTLCEPCFEEEEAEFDGDRGNDLPERLDMYRANLRAGPLNFRAPVPPLSNGDR